MGHTAPPLDHDRPRHAQRLEVHGTVQGVGFRPFVHRLATTLGLDGRVCNVGGHVVVEAAGDAAALAQLAQRLHTDAPAHARVVRVVTSILPLRVVPPGAGFRVEASTADPGAERDLPPDLATCDDCLAELFDPANRRYRYPFLNCAACGPRATIIDDLPYDRERTAMSAFPMCPACAAEYADPADRRFHAEPVACPDCGPRLAWLPGGRSGEEALRAAVAVIATGGVVAVKGLGGYQLVCDATQESAVRTLRARKHRESKPFAVMVGDLAAVRELCATSPEEERLLTSAARPVVLAAVQPAAQATLASTVAPALHRLGVFLPATPLHHLLLAELARPLVVTSGNRSDEPIAIDDDDALDRLASIADGFLVHDRAIRARYDDSVAVVADGVPTVVRRARGYAPAPLPLRSTARRPLLAVGAELKHTFALGIGDRALVGPHTGDLEDADTLAAFETNLAHLCRLEGVEPQVVAHDLHPGYLSTQHAVAHFAEPARVPVQHHHAHVASCAAEHGVSGPFIGVAYDGLGLGDDGTLWGGEVLVADLRGYRRVGRFGRAPLPGGAAAVRRPARMALGYLFGGEPLGGAVPDGDGVRDFLDRLDPREVEVVRTLVARRLNSPVASSAGRLFDAAAALLGVRDDARYEGEAAMLLEAAADPDVTGELPWRLAADAAMPEIAVYDPLPTLAAVAAAAATGTRVAAVAARFHRTVAAATVTLCEHARRAGGPPLVCLSGGVFQNQLLLGQVTAGLRGAGFDVLVNHEVPTNDGGISYGQAAVAAALTGGG